MKAPRRMLRKMEQVLFKKQTRNGHQSPFWRYLPPTEEVVANFSRSILFKKTHESQKVNSSVPGDCGDRKIGMITTIKNFTPQVIRRVIRYTWRKVRPFPYRITLTNFVSEGCKFEVTTRVEESRVVSLGNEEEFIRLFLAEIQPGDVVFDVGSCVGLHALHAALRGARVVAFEPDPSYRSRLETNVRLNSLDNVQIIDWAVSNIQGVVNLFTDGVEGFSPSLREVDKRDSIRVRCDKIDDALKRCEIPIPDVVKIDIEGAEILALQGMQELLSSDAPPRTLFVEIHPDYLLGFDSSAEEVENLLKTFGYQQKYRVQRKNEVHCIYRKVTRGR